ncbi:hypothetical protein ACROYT_G037957 [Oculina patagonica]
MDERIRKFFECFDEDLPKPALIPSTKSVISRLVQQFFLLIYNHTTDRRIFIFIIFDKDYNDPQVLCYGLVYRHILSSTGYYCSQCHITPSPQEAFDKYQLRQRNTSQRWSELYADIGGSLCGIVWKDRGSQYGVRCLHVLSSRMEGPTTSKRG